MSLLLLPTLVLDNLVEVSGDSVVHPTAEIGELVEFNVTFSAGGHELSEILEGQPDIIEGDNDVTILFLVDRKGVNLLVAFSDFLDDVEDELVVFFAVESIVLFHNFNLFKFVLVHRELAYAFLYANSVPQIYITTKSNRVNSNFLQKSAFFSSDTRF